MPLPPPLTPKSACSRIQSASVCCNSYEDCSVTSLQAVPLSDSMTYLAQSILSVCMPANTQAEGNEQEAV